MLIIVSQECKKRMLLYFTLQQSLRVIHFYICALTEYNDNLIIQHNCSKLKFSFYINCKIIRNIISVFIWNLNFKVLIGFQKMPFVPGNTFLEFRRFKNIF